MPASYTHYSFGEEVYKRLPENLIEVIDKCKDAYYIGLNGPDILFYYKPLTKNPIKAYGHEIHEEIAESFFQGAKNYIFKNKDDICLSYILGFLCHFALDSTCHPYIGEAQKASGFSHGFIEAELEGAMMERNGVSPQRQNAGAHINANKEVAKHICNLYQGLEEVHIYKCLKSVRFYNSLLTCENEVKRKFIKGVLKKIKGGDSFSDMIINLHPDPKAKDIINNLVNLYEKALEEAIQLISAYYTTIITDSKINKGFNKNFL